MCLSIINVKGDGHCFYRCIWRIAKSIPEMAEALYICNVVEELEGAQEIREFVAIMLCVDYTLDVMIETLVEFKEFGGNDDVCPLLQHVDPHLSVKENRVILSGIVKDTAIYASKIEIDIIERNLLEINIGIVVLTWNTGEEKTDVADKWLFQMKKYLLRMDTKHVILLVNEDNVHFKYMKAFGNVLVDRQQLLDHVQEKIDTDTDESDFT